MTEQAPIAVDVFISYSHQDEPVAALVARALEKQGLSVWWDRHIPVGSTWDEWIGARLDAARCVVVLWSRASVASRWVRAEATKAEGRLFPILVEPVALPMPFNLTQTADLTGWSDEDEGDKRLDAVVHAVASFAPGAPQALPPYRDPAPSSWLKWRLRRETVAIGGILTFVIATSTWWWQSRYPDALKTAEAVQEVTNQLEQDQQASRSGRGARAQLDVIEQRLNRALSDDPDSNQLRKLKADVYRVSGRDEDALAYVQQSIADIPGDSVLYNELGFIHQRMARLPQSIDAYRKSIGFNSDAAAVGVAYANLAEVFITRKEFEEAKKCFRAGLAVGTNRDQLCGDLRDVVQTREAFSDMQDLLHEQCS